SGAATWAQVSSAWPSVRDLVESALTTTTSASRTLGQALETCAQVAAPLVGVVLNRASETEQYYEPYQAQPAQQVTFDAVDDFGADSAEPEPEPADDESLDDESEPAVP
ncbi:MAG: hypothetical protein AAGK32_17930, partial [Actinomycetota bacterium]